MMQQTVEISNKYPKYLYKLIMMPLTPKKISLPIPVIFIAEVNKLTNSKNTLNAKKNHMDVIA